MRHLSRSLAAAALILGALLASAASAQSFGKNKVHYENLQWSVLQTPHVRLHYYAQEESLARALAAFAESTAVEFDGRFHVHPRHRVPVLLYSTHHLFQQTNATPEQLTEAVGGLTELIKGRVLLPHNGSWARLRWVTRHEFTHAYQLEKFEQVMHAHHRPPTWFPPLWFTEGLAEHCGTTWDADAEGLLRDMVCSRMAYPMTRSEPITGSVEMYKEGQNFLDWLSAKYGDARIFDLLENTWRGDDFETVFKITYGRELREVDDEWFESVRKHYLPMVATCVRPQEVARPFRQPNRFNLGARALPARADSDTTIRFCNFEADDGAQDLVVSERGPSGKRHERRLLRGGGSPAFESFHLFQSRPGASADGRIVVASKHGGRDALYVLDVASGRIEREMEFPELVAIHDPVFEPSGLAVVMAAQDYDGQSDLYRVSWDAKSTRSADVVLQRITHDDYDDEEPAISPDGRYLAFASDRGESAGHYALFRLPLTGGAIEQVSFPGAADDRQPAYSPDGRWLAFRSTRGGTSDLYVRSAEPSHEVRRVTRMLGPVSDPDWVRSGRGLIFTAQDHVTFHTFAVPCVPESLAVEEESPPAVVPVLPAIAHTDPPQDYQRRLGLDLLQNGVVFDPGFGGAGGGGQLAFSDVLGNEQYYLSFANDSEDFGDFWDGWEGGLTYINQSHRLNYGLGVFRLTRLYDPDFDVLRREKRLGLLGLVSYPFNHFDRIEASVQIRHATDHLLRNGDAPTVDLVSNFVSLVHDNSRWTWDGPIAGVRLNLTTGYTRDMTTGRADYGTVLGEARVYRRPLPFAVLASRGVVESSLGRDAQRSFIGGPTRLRVPERREMAGLQTITWQEELRFPLLQGLVLAVPAPWMLPSLNGAVFADGAWAYDHDLHDRKGVVGFSAYFGGGFYPALRWNWTWTSSDLKRFDSRKPTMFFTLAYNY
jgi:hypothetical protein